MVLGVLLLITVTITGMRLDAADMIRPLLIKWVMLFANVHHHPCLYRLIHRRLQANTIASPSTQPGNEGTGSLQGHSDPGQGASVSSPTKMEVELLIRIANDSG